MSNVTEQKRCQKCGEPIPAEAPQGLCPKCLFKQACVPTEAGRGESAKSAPPTLEELAAAFPQLEVLRLVGQGGMGFVFKARQPTLDRFVALKILPRSLASDPAFAERFTREGRMLARLNHPNIVAIHDFGQAGGFFYLLMEFVDGVNLRQAMQVGRFTPAQALSVVPRICEALQFAHNEGILHRDIKPENILLDSKGRVKIADFGIAKLLGEPHTGASLTASGAMLGTPHYMAPEQLEKSGKVDQRADIYSLGVVFYEMLTGELPLGRFQPPSEKVQVDVRLDEVVLHALEKEPARRYQHVSQVKTAVETIAANPADPATSVGTRPFAAAAAGPEHSPDRFWRWFAVIVPALIMIPAGILVVAWDWARHQQPSATLTAQSGKTVGPASATNEMLVAGPSDLGPGELVIDTLQRQPSHPKPGCLDWNFNCFVPPGHLARVLFVCWTNGVPNVVPGFSGYLKVGKAGGIDADLSLSCEPISESLFSGAMNANAEERRRLAAWGFSESQSAGVTNAVQWNVCLGLGFTTGAWMPMPPYQRLEPPRRLIVTSGHQGTLRLVDFVTPGLAGSETRSGIELRVFLEPYGSSPIRTGPNEVDRTNFVGGTGLAGTMQDALKSIKQWPTAP